MKDLQKDWIDRNTPRKDTPMKSAEEIAVKIMTLFNESDRKTLTVVEVINLLGEFAEARGVALQAPCTDGELHQACQCLTEYILKVRDSALEEAAKVAETFKKKGVAHVNCIVDADCEQAGATADAIRALKDSNTDGGTTVEIDAYLDIWRKSKGEI